MYLCMHGSRDHGEGFGFHWRWPTRALLSPHFFRIPWCRLDHPTWTRLRGCYEGTFFRPLIERGTSATACRGGTAKCLEMPLQTAPWGENHCQSGKETPCTAEREFGNEGKRKHGQSPPQKETHDASLHLPVLEACAHTHPSLFPLPLARRAPFARESHFAFDMAEPGTPPPGAPSPERPTACVSSSDSNSLRRSVERLFKRPMAAKGHCASTSTASAATGSTPKSPSKQAVVSTEVSASPELGRGTTAPPLSERELAPTPLSRDARYGILEQTTSARVATISCLWHLGTHFADTALAAGTPTVTPLDLSRAKFRHISHPNLLSASMFPRTKGSVGEKKSYVSSAGT